MKNFQRTKFGAVLFSFALLLAALAPSAVAQATWLTFKANNKVISEGQKQSASLGELSMAFSGDADSVERIEMFALKDGEVKNTGQFTKVAAFNANASNFARNMAQAGDELKVRIMLKDGTTANYVLRLTN